MGSKDYPTWVYGTEGKARMVMTEEEHQSLEGEWHDSPDKVSDAQKPEDAEASGNDEGGGTAAYIERPRPTMRTLKSGHTHRDRLEAEADALNVKYSRNTSNEELQDRILKAASD